MLRDRCLSCCCYDARLAYGGTIGAYFSGIAKASLHRGERFIAALPGSVLGTRLRPFSGSATSARSLG